MTEIITAYTPSYYGMQVLPAEDRGNKLSLYDDLNYTAQEAETLLNAIADLDNVYDAYAMCGVWGDARSQLSNATMAARRQLAIDLRTILELMYAPDGLRSLERDADELSYDRNVDLAEELIYSAYDYAEQLDAAGREA